MDLRGCTPESFIKSPTGGVRTGVMPGNMTSPSTGFRSHTSPTEDELLPKIRYAMLHGMSPGAVSVSSPRHNELGSEFDEFESAINFLDSAGASSARKTPAISAQQSPLFKKYIKSKFFGAAGQPIALPPKFSPVQSQLYPGTPEYTKGKLLNVDHLSRMFDYNQHDADWDDSIPGGSRLLSHLRLNTSPLQLQRTPIWARHNAASVAPPARVVSDADGEGVLVMHTEPAAGNTGTDAGFTTPRRNTAQAALANAWATPPLSGAGLLKEQTWV